MRHILSSTALALTLMTAPALAEPQIVGGVDVSTLPSAAQVKQDLRAFAEGFVTDLHAAPEADPELTALLRRYFTPGTAEEMRAAWRADIRDIVIGEVPVASVELAAPPAFEGRIGWRDDVDYEHMRGPWAVQVPVNVIFTDEREEWRVVQFQIVETQSSDARPERFAIAGVRIR